MRKLPETNPADTELSHIAMRASADLAPVVHPHRKLLFFFEFVDI